MPHLDDQLLDELQVLKSSLTRTLVVDVTSEITPLLRVLSHLDCPLLNELQVVAGALLQGGHQLAVARLDGVLHPPVQQLTLAVAALR